MATGGRVLHHPRRVLPDARNAVVIVGFAAEGTRARDLVDGARTLKMFGQYVPVRAEIANVPHFSAHADAGQIVDWLRGAPAPNTTYMVHGEPGAAGRFATVSTRSWAGPRSCPAQVRPFWSADSACPLPPPDEYTRPRTPGHRATVPHAVAPSGPVR